MSEYIVSLNDVNKKDRQRVGGKAANLGELIRAGILVPPGFAVTVSAYDYFLANSSLPPNLLSELSQIQAQLGGKIALRSSATVEDESNLSLAGAFNTHYLEDQSQIEEALLDIFNQARSTEILNLSSLHGINPADIKMGLVAQRLVQPDLAGVTYTGVNGDQVLIQYVEGFGASLVDGERSGISILASNSGQILAAPQLASLSLADPLLRLVTVSQQIKNLFGGQDQDIEFAIENPTIYILQARALTRELGPIKIEETVEDTLANVKTKLKSMAVKEKMALGTRKAIFHDSNLSELLPAPTQMEIGIFQYLFTGREGKPGAMQIGRRELGYPLGDETPGLMEYIGGRPYASTARHAGMFYAGFPDSVQEYYKTLVSEYLQAIDEDPNRGRYPEMGLFLQDPSLDDLVTRFGSKGQQYYERYLSFAELIAKEAEHSSLRSLGDEEAQRRRYGDFSDQLDTNLNQYDPSELIDFVVQRLEYLRTGPCVDFVKVARLGFYYAQRLQSELSKRYPKNEAQQKFGQLSSLLPDSQITRVNLQIASLPPDQAYGYTLRSLGHSSAKGEVLEIRHPRLKDDPEALKAYVDSLQKAGYMQDSGRRLKQRQALEAEILEALPEDQKAVFKALIDNAQTYMSLRETVKYHFTREYSPIRDALEVLQTRFGLAQGDIYYLYPWELADVEVDLKRFKQIVDFRRQAYRNYPHLDLPPVIREQDIDKLALKKITEAEFFEAVGKLLSSGEKIEAGVVVNLDQFENAQAAQQQVLLYKEAGENVILVARQINLSHDPLLALTDATLIENADITSHGAQRARELGRMALGGIKANLLPTGMILDIDPESRIVKRVTPTE